MTRNPSYQKGIINKVLFKHLTPHQARGVLKDLFPSAREPIFEPRSLTALQI